VFSAAGGLTICSQSLVGSAEANVVHVIAGEGTPVHRQQLAACMGRLCGPRCWAGSLAPCSCMADTVQAQHIAVCQCRSSGFEFGLLLLLWCCSCCQSAVCQALLRSRHAEGAGIVFMCGVLLLCMGILGSSRHRAALT
jgi:hypothetical protein